MLLELLWVVVFLCFWFSCYSIMLLFVAGAGGVCVRLWLWGVGFMLLVLIVFGYVGFGQ